MDAEHRMVFVCLRRLMLVLTLLLLVGSRAARAQTIAESAATSSVARGGSAQSGTVVWPQKTTSAAQNTFAHLVAPSGPPAEVTNRLALEKRAGKDASKLLLRSLPTGAQVWIDGAFVGNTPLLLLVPPGKYQIQMSGQRLEFAKQIVAVLPRKTQEVELTLAVRYPLRVMVH